jgi:hypothetical protein
MGTGRNEQIRELAYRIWQEEGYPEGHEVQHWLKAEAIWLKELREEHRAKSTRKERKPVKVTKRRKTAPTEITL